jgi:hypothetical protein
MTPQALSDDITVPRTLRQLFFFLGTTVGGTLANLSKERHQVIPVWR